MPTIKRIYVRHYRDNNERMAYVDWDDGSTTEGKATRRGRPFSLHMRELFARGEREGLRVEKEVW